MTPPPALVRPSELARFWGLHPRTLHSWIREGRLPAIRSPGNHFRLRVSDVRAFCEREGLAVPPFVSPPSPRVVIAAAAAPLLRALGRALKATAVLDAFADPYEAFVAAAAEPTEILAMGAGPHNFDAVAAVRAFKSRRATASVVVVAFGVPSRKRQVALEKAGASRAIALAQTSELLPRVLGEILGQSAP